MEMFLFWVLFVIAFAIGGVMTYFTISPKTAGYLIVDMTDPDNPYPYLQLDDVIEESILPNEYVTLKVQKINPKSQN